MFLSGPCAILKIVARAPRSPKSQTESPSGSGELPSPGAPTSLKDLSAHLGLSTAAVSRVLNAAPAAQSIPKSTQDRIFAAANSLNYRPNLFARSLRNRRSQTIGVLVPEVSEGYATLVLAGIEQALLDAGYFYFLVSHHHRPEMIDRCQRLLLERAVEAIIAIDTLLPHRCPVPTVTVSGHREPEGVTNIVLDHRRAAELALGHLSSLGHSKIAFIKGQSFSSDTQARWRGIRNAAKLCNLRIDPRLVAQLRGDLPTHEPGYLATQHLLKQQPQAGSSPPFTALFAFNDVSAIGAVRALREAGLRIPQDVSVVGFDDVQSAAFQNPALTTVRQPLHTMGKLAAESVLKMINSSEAETTTQLVVEPELIIRESTCPASASALPFKPLHRAP